MRWLIVTLAFLLSAPAVAQETAPFGLRWGMTSAQAIAAGVQLVEPSKYLSGLTFMTRSLPEGLKDTGWSSLDFNKEGKLWRVSTKSTPFASDPFGRLVRARIDEIVDAISEKNGEAQLVSVLPSTVKLAQPDRFAESLYLKQRVYGFSWLTKAMIIDITAESEDDKTYYVLTYRDRKLAEKALE